MLHSTHWADNSVCHPAARVALLCTGVALLTAAVTDAAENRGAYGVNVTVDTMVAMRDGVRLATDVYRPAQ